MTIKISYTVQRLKKVRTIMPQRNIRPMRLLKRTKCHIKQSFARYHHHCTTSYAVRVTHNMVVLPEFTNVSEERIECFTNDCLFHVL